MKPWSLQQNLIKFVTHFITKTTDFVSLNKALPLQILTRRLLGLLHYDSQLYMQLVHILMHRDHLIPSKPIT